VVALTSRVPGRTRLLTTRCRSRNTLAGAEAEVADFCEFLLHDRRFVS